VRLIFTALAVAAVLGVTPSLTAAATSLDLAFSTDRPTYAVGDTVTFALTVTNSTSAPETLNFRTSQEYDFIVRAADGTAVWQWSCHKLFLAAEHTRTIGPGETVTFTAQWDQTTCVPFARNQGKQVKPGTYSVVGELTSDPAFFSSPVSFQIVR
jgi:Intracellular proteinase inhibitor